YPVSSRFSWQTHLFAHPCLGLLVGVEQSSVKSIQILGIISRDHRYEIVVPFVDVYGAGLGLLRLLHLQLPPVLPFRRQWVECLQAAVFHNRANHRLTSL